jgi:hypothetical protein
MRDEIPFTYHAVVTLRAAMPDISFRAMLKPLDVEELVDLVVHRPLAWAITRAAYPTPVTPDQITWASMFVGIAAGAATWASLRLGAPYMALAGALFILSAVLDCSDGQLARLRGTSSPFGRMLDGAVDAVVQCAVVPAVIVHVYFRAVPSNALAWLALSFVAVVTGLAHTVLYDHYKNVYLCQTEAHYHEGDDPETLDAVRATRRAQGFSLSDWMRFEIAAPYLARQRALFAWIDPRLPSRFRDMPGYTPARAERYRVLNRGLMRAWTFYGIGTHIFGLGVAMMFDAVAHYVVLRAVLFNLGLFVLVPVQRRATRAYFAQEAAS